MPRLRQVARSELSSPRVRDTYQRHFGDDGPAPDAEVPHRSTGSWWTVFALDEALFELMLDRHGWQFSDDRELAPALRELALARTGWVAESEFVFAQHCKIAARVGVPAGKIAALPSWPVHTDWTDGERAVLAYTDALVGGGGRVDDATFDTLRATLSDVAILELTFMVTTYVSSATITRALRLEHDDRDDPLAAAASRIPS